MQSLGHLHADSLLPAYFLESLRKGMQHVLVEDGTLTHCVAFVVQVTDRNVRELFGCHDEKAKVGLIPKRYVPELLAQIEGTDALCDRLLAKQEGYRMPTLVLTDEGCVVQILDYTVTPTSETVRVEFTCHRCQQAVTH